MWGSALSTSTEESFICIYIPINSFIEVIFIHLLLAIVFFFNFTNLYICSFILSVSVCEQLNCDVLLVCIGRRLGLESVSIQPWTARVMFTSTTCSRHPYPNNVQISFYLAKCYLLWTGFRAELCGENFSEYLCLLCAYKLLTDY